MRTRRSPRNQEILFRALFKPEPVKPEPFQGPRDERFLSSRCRAELARERALEAQRERVRVILASEPPP